MLSYFYRMMIRIKFTKISLFPCLDQLSRSLSSNLNIVILKNTVFDEDVY
jgi:hypothetical protein